MVRLVWLESDDLDDVVKRWFGSKIRNNVSCQKKS